VASKARAFRPLCKGGYRLEGSRWVVASAHGGADAARAEPFDAVELRLARWWLEA
jgi:hypothetical protein